MSSSSRQFHITEANYFEFRAEAFNTFNHTNPNNPNATLGNANYGKVTGAADPRIMEEFLRFVRDGGPTDTSPLAARESVAAACAATDSLRHGGRPQRVPPVTPALRRHFAA